jgi:hypothetical protein
MKNVENVNFRFYIRAHNLINHTFSQKSIFFERL